MRILVIEDDPHLLESIVLSLKDEYEVDTATHGDEGLYLAMQSIYDAIILDLMLPEIDGFTIVASLRKNQVKTPVMVLTARDALDDKVKGLDLGADDYLVKPFMTPELLARLRALLRRSGALTTDRTLCYRGIKLFGREYDIEVDGARLRLTQKEYELLEYLLQNVGIILTREQIYDRIWGFQSETTIGIVEVYIHYLRKKLAPFGYDRYLKTVRGIGYQLSPAHE